MHCFLELPSMKDKREGAQSAESSFSPRNYAEVDEGSYEFDGMKVTIAENIGEGARHRSVL